MLVRMKRVVVLGVMTLATAVVSLPVVSFAATSPSVSVLSSLTQGLRTPGRVALDADGNIYVADQRAGGIVKFNQYGESLLTIRTAFAPSGLAIAQDGSLLVSQSSFVARYNAVTGEEIGRLADGYLNCPLGVAVHGVNGYVYVVDGGAKQVVVFNAQGAYVKSFAGGSFVAPASIAYEKVSGQFAVADTYGNKIKFFDGEGVLVKTLGEALSSALGASAGPMQFAAPVSVAFEYSKGISPVLNRMYVVDAFSGNVQVVDPATSTALNIGSTGKNYIGAPGTGSGQLMVPSDAVFDASNNRLLVVNGFGNIAIFGIDGGSNPVNVTPVTPVDPPVVVAPAPALAVAAVPSITKSPVVTITGTVDAGSVVSVVNQKTAVAGTAVVTGGSWKYDVTLSEGVNTLGISAQQSNSAKSAVSADILLDTTSPVLSVSALTNGSTTSTQVQNISGTVVDQSGATVSVNGAAVALNGNAFSAAVTLLNGSNQVSVVAVDAVGNVKSDVRTINFDPAQPVITIANADNSYTTNSIVTVTGTVDVASEITVAGVPAVVEGGNWSAKITLADGINTINVVAKGQGGKVATDKRTITLDAAKPVLAVVSPAQDVAVSVPNIQISGNVSDNTALVVESSVNGVSTPVVVNGGAYALNVDFAAEGTYPVVITAKDAAGNISTIVRNVIFDKTPPVFTLNQVGGVAPEKLSGTVESGSSVVIKDGASQIGVVKVANGSWSADLAGVTYDSDNLRAIAIDAAGNSTSKSLVYSFPDGTLNGGVPTVQDAMRAIRIVVNQLTPSAQELAHYDIGPLVNGKPNPNGKIEIVDAILILRKALGLKSW